MSHYNLFRYDKKSVLLYGVDWLVAEATATKDKFPTTIIQKSPLATKPFAAISQNNSIAGDSFFSPRYDKKNTLFLF